MLRPARLPRDHRPAERRRPAPAALFEKNGVGSYSVRLHRGPYFESGRRWTPSPAPRESPLHDPLRAIGFDDAAIARILRTYQPQLIQVWADITLAASERSPDFFRVSPQAYFMDNVEQASRSGRTPPDWWYEHRKEEERRDRESHRARLDLPPAGPTDREDDERAFDAYLLGEGQAPSPRSSAGSSASIAPPVRGSPRPVDSPRTPPGP